MTKDTYTKVVAAADDLSVALRPVSEAAEPIGRAAHVLDPTTYKRANYHAFLRLAASGPRELLVVGMNPGPHGMAQTGVPFGDVDTARRIIGADAPGGHPVVFDREHKVLWACKGLDYGRVEESGRRLWGALETFFGGGDLDDTLARACVVNYCPLLFLDAGGRNVTPADLPKRSRVRSMIEDACDEHLRRVVAALAPRVVVTLGEYADTAALRALNATRGPGTGHRGAALDVASGPTRHPRGWARDGGPVQVLRLDHPSPLRYRVASEWLSAVAPVFARLAGGEFAAEVL